MDWSTTLRDAEWSCRGGTLCRQLGLAALFGLLSGGGIAEDRACLEPPRFRAEVLEADAGVRVRGAERAAELVLGWDGKPDLDGFHVVIDDSVCMRQPVFSRQATGRSLTVNVLEAGLAPGVRYYLLIQPGGLTATFRILAEAPPEPVSAHRWLGRAWETTGRKWIHRHSGVRWEEATRKWELDPDWQHAGKREGPEAYYIEYASRLAVERALSSDDLALMDELAAFHLVHLERFTTLGELRSRGSLSTSTRLLDDRGPDATRTLGWLQRVDARARVRECALCNSQFLHPAARLLRGITTLPDDQRTTAMRRFGAVYGPLMVREHLIRLAYEVEWDYWGAGHLPGTLVAIWATLARTERRSERSYQHAMLDRDLWLIATAAELLGAHANDPELVALSATELARLRRLVRVGVRLFQSKRSLHHDAHDWRGRPVPTASYFDGDFDDHRDMAFAGYSGQTYPESGSRTPPRDGSWDISHAYRIPVFLRSLYDNQKATGLAFPGPGDIALVINQYLYTVFHGDLAAPLFRNFFDGRDGWYRAGLGERQAGHPPSRHCDSRPGSNRPCLTPGAIFGWGLVAFFSTDLMELRQAQVALAVTRDPEAIRFRTRYYTFQGERFEWEAPNGSARYPLLLWVLLSTADAVAP